MAKRRPMLNHLIRSEKEEVARVRHFLKSADISDSPLWHAPDVPTFYNAVMFLAPQFDIVPVKEEVSPSQGRYVATVTAKRGRLSRIGAASSRDESVAKCLAYRNAIRQLLPQQSKLGWREKRQRARRHI